MHMSLTPKVTHVICKRCDCHPITIQDVAAAVTAAGQDASFLINNLGAPYRNSIPVVYSNWLQDCNSQGVLLSCTEYLVYRVLYVEDVNDWLAIRRALTRKKNYGIILLLVFHPLLFYSTNPRHGIFSFIICIHWLRDLFTY